MAESIIRIGFIMIIILPLRLIAIFVTSWHLDPIPREYEDVANNILAGNGFQYTHLDTTYRVFSLPVYPLLCAGIYSITKQSSSL